MTSRLPDDIKTMEPRHFAFAMSQGMGHLKPMMPYMGEMLARGHNVTLFCSNDPIFRLELEKEGLSKVLVVGVKVMEIQEFMKKSFVSTLPQGGPLCVSEPLFQAIVDHYKLEDERRPAVLVADFFATAAFDAGDALSIPVVTVFPNPLGLTSLPPPNVRSFWDKHVNAKLCGAAEAVGSRFLVTLRNRERRKRGLVPLLEQDVYPCLSQQRPIISSTGPPFEYDFPHSPLLHFVGPSARASCAPLGKDLARWLDETASSSGVIYVAFGTINNFCEPDLETLCGQLLTLPEGVSILWSLPEEQQRRLPFRRDKVGEWGDEVPPSWRLESFTPQYAVLQHSAVKVFVTHNGSNSTYEAILNEVPMVCCPTGKDQFANAARVKAAGLGVVVENGARGKVADAIRTVLDKLPTFVATAKRVKNDLAFLGGAKRAADIIEAMADRKGVEGSLPPRRSLVKTAVAALAVGGAAALVGIY